MSCSGLNAEHSPAVCTDTEDSPKDSRDHGVQTDIDSVTFQQLVDDNIALRSENSRLAAKLNMHDLKTEAFEGNNELVTKLTGLSSYAMLMVLFNHIVAYLPSSAKLSPFQQMMLCLVRLRLNINFDFLSFVFGVSASTACRTFATVVDIMNKELVPHVVFWPDREELRKTMPMVFRNSPYRHTVVIIDCFEVFIERPSDLMARAQTYSQYKSHNTVKYLIGISPQGCIIFISRGWGGRTSDKCVTENSGFLGHLNPGDQVLADRGFPVAENIALYGASLHIPAFTKGKKQLAAQDVESTRQLASVRIHVERVIGVVRQKFTMLQSTIPIACLATDTDSGLTTLDKVVRVACALCNMCKSVVNKD